MSGDKFIAAGHADVAFGGFFIWSVLFSEYIVVLFMEYCSRSHEFASNLHPRYS